MFKNINLHIFGYLITLLFGGIVGFYLFVFSSELLDTSGVETEVTSIREAGYNYISPLLDCDSSSNISEKISKNIKRDVEREIEKAYKQDFSTHVSVYFRDLNIEEDASFSPASLLKVPVMITVFKIAETNPEFLSTPIKFEKSMRETSLLDGADLPQEYLPQQRLVSGKDYSVLELVERMIMYSDNDSFDLLLLNIPTQELEEVHHDLGLIYPDEQTPSDFISVKAYSSIFRILYNASYLNSFYSEEALRILSGTTFDIGIAGGVDADLEVANKFGVKKLFNTSESFQLHDCGIVYHPRGPYLLCVMTKGNNINELSRLITQISNTVYGSL
jgi:beta-lactamase class A